VNAIPFRPDTPASNLGRIDHVRTVAEADTEAGVVFGALLGGFTTFSTFGLDTVTLFRTGTMIQALSSVLIQVWEGSSASMAGWCCSSGSVPRFTSRSRAVLLTRWKRRRRKEK
jgi:hypothetical protein